MKRSALCILFLFVFLSGFLSYAIGADSRIALFKKELNNFIDTVKKQTIKQGKYDVYVVSFYPSRSNPYNLCFTFGHIYNANKTEYEQIHATHYFIFEDEYVLVQFIGEDQSFLNGLNLDCLNPTIEKTIFNKLHPTQINGLPAGITGFNIEERGCIVADSIQRSYSFH